MNSSGETVDSSRRQLDPESLIPITTRINRYRVQWTKGFPQLFFRYPLEGSSFSVDKDAEVSMANFTSLSPISPRWKVHLYEHSMLFSNARGYLVDHGETVEFTLV